MSDWNATEARASIARKLREIESLHLDLWAEALYRHSDRDMPGGDAMNMLGPVANVEAWQHRYEAAEAKARDYGAELPAYIQDQLDTETHPLLVLATWESLIREERDQVTEKSATVPSAVGFLRDSIDWMFRLDEFGYQQWLGVDALETELSKVQSALENVLHAGIRVDRGADCLTCHRPLVHEWAGNHENPKTIEDDHWYCDSCGQRSSYPQYMKAVEDQHLGRATWLSANYMLARYDIPVGTLQGWASKGHVRKKLNIHNQRMMYHVGDAVARKEVRADAA